MSSATGWQSPRADWRSAVSRKHKGRHNVAAFGWGAVFLLDASEVVLRCRGLRAM